MEDRTFNSTFNFRIACEECHTRKIKCYSSDSNTRACKNCLQNGRKCLFSLKGKLGHPRQMQRNNSDAKEVHRPDHELQSTARPELQTTPSPFPSQVMAKPFELANHSMQEVFLDNYDLTDPVTFNLHPQQVSRSSSLLHHSPNMSIPLQSNSRQNSSLRSTPKSQASRNFAHGFPNEDQSNSEDVNIDLRAYRSSLDQGIGGLPRPGRQSHQQGLEDGNHTDIQQSRDMMISPETWEDSLSLFPDDLMEFSKENFSTSVT